MTRPIYYRAELTRADLTQADLTQGRVDPHSLYAPKKKKRKKSAPINRIKNFALAILRGRGMPCTPSPESASALCI